jgi:amino acid transporter
MSLDGQIPFGKPLAWIHPRTKVPVLATIVTAIVALIIIFGTLINIKGVNVSTTVINYSVVGIYLSFQCVVFARILSRFTQNDQWRITEGQGYFSMGSLSLPVAIIAQIYGILMIVNLVWPRPYDDISGYLILIALGAVVLLGFVLMIFTFTLPLYSKSSKDTK